MVGGRAEAPLTAKQSHLLYGNQKSGGKEKRPPRKHNCVKKLKFQQGHTEALG